MVRDFMERNQNLNPDIWSKILLGRSKNTSNGYIFSFFLQTVNSLFPPFESWYFIKPVILQKQLPELFYKKTIFTGNHLCWSPVLMKFHAFRPATLLKRDSNRGVVLWILRNFQEHLFWRTSANGCFWSPTQGVPLYDEQDESHPLSTLNLK